MTDETYNGWPNRDTWNVSLWIDNEEPWYRDKIRYLRRTATVTGSGVESFVRELFYGVTSFDGTVKNSTPDGANLARVDWDCIADHWSDEAAELDQ
jgi:hypothetical protein